METIAEFDAALAAVDAEIAPLHARRIAIRKDREALIDLLVEDGADDAFLMAHCDNTTAAHNAMNKRVRALGSGFYSYTRFPVGWHDDYGPESPIGPHLSLPVGPDEAELTALVAGIREFTARFVNPDLLDRDDAAKPGMVYADLCDTNTSPSHSWGIYYSLDFETAFIVDRAHHIHAGWADPQFEGTLTEVLAKAATLTNGRDTYDDEYGENY